MSNKIVTGEYQPHLESALVREVRRLKESTSLSPLIIVVPTNLLALHLSRLLALKLGGHAELHFLTLLDLARRLAQRPLAMKGLSAMPPMADQLILHRAVRECLDKHGSSYFSKVSETDGFLRVFLEAVGDLKEGCLKPDDLIAALEEVELRPVAVDKIREVAALWRAYEAGKASAGFYDRADLMSEAASNAASDRRLGGIRELLIYGFYDLNPLQMRLVERCASVRETVVFFPYRDEPAFEYARPTLDWLKSLEFRLVEGPSGTEEHGGEAAEPGGIEARLPGRAEAIGPGDAVVSPSGLQRLKTGLFTRPASQIENPAGVVVLSAPGEIRESREICRGILRMAGLGEGRASAFAVEEERGLTSALEEQRGPAFPAKSLEVAKAMQGGVDTCSTGAAAGVSAPKIEKGEGRTLTDGLRFNEVGILLREPTKYVGHLARVFDAVGVEPFITEGLPLGGSRAARSLILLMELIGSDFARRRVMDFLTFAEIDFGSFLNGGRGPRPQRRDSSSTGVASASSVEGANPALWDLLSKEAGVVKGLDSWGERLRALRNRVGPSHSTGELQDKRKTRTDSDRERALSTLIRFMEKLAARISSFPAADAPAKLLEKTIALYDALIAPSPEREKVTGAIGDLALLDSCARTLERSVFFWLVGRHLGQVQSRLGSFQGEGPTVAGLMAARGLPFRVVVLPGLTEGWFPKGARQDPILLDGERRTLNRVFAAAGLKGKLGLKADRLKEEKLLFRLGIGAASRFVLLTFPRLDPLTGGERIPSSFLLEAVRAVTGKSCDTRSLDGLPIFDRLPLSRTFPDDGAFMEQSEFDLNLAEIATVGRGSGARAHLERGDTFFKNVIEAERRRWGESLFTRYDGAMEAPEAIASLQGRYVGGAGVAAPTSLEDYASCPFAYFMRHILGIEPVDDPEELLSITPKDRGGLAHKILERTYRKIFSGGERPRRDWKAVLLSEAREVLDSYRSRFDFGLPLLWELEEERLVEDLVFSVRSDLEKLEGFTPWKLELAYGLKRGERSEEPLQFPLSDGRRIPLGGVMDRVDRDRAARKARVIDYKSGSGAVFKNDRLRGGRTLQLPLYVLGARHLFGAETEVDGAEYFFVSGPRRGSRVRFTARAVDERMEDLKTVLRTVVHGVEAGLFFACPGDSCRYCRYSMACGQGRRLFEKKRTDPRAAAFLEMVEID